MAGATVLQSRLRATTRVLYDSVRELTATLSSEEACKLLLDQALRHLGALRGSVLVLETPRSLRIACSVGVPEEVCANLRISLGDGICGGVAATHESVCVADVESTNVYPKARGVGYETGSYMCVPIVYQRRLRGVLTVADRADGAAFAGEDLSLLEELAGHGAVALQNAERYEALLQRAQHDGLTGLVNRSHFWAVLKTELARAKRYERSVSVVMIDVDYFKQYNDRLGHLAGDRALERVASVIRCLCRASDTAGRYGGEEFGVVLPETAIDGAVRLAEKIREGVIADDWDSAGATLTISAGVASYPVHGKSARVLVEAADRQLYRAKARGRNRVCFPSDGNVD